MSFQQQAEAILAKVTIGPTKCAWCLVTIKDGDPSLPVSHGVCPSCRERLEREVA